MAHFTATLPAPTAGPISLDRFLLDEDAGFDQLRQWLGAHQHRAAELELTIPLPVTPSLATDVVQLLAAPGMAFNDPENRDRAEIVAHAGQATIRITMDILIGGAS
ncbi:hypothetical protein OG730_41855 (plasmid) [Streptomyces sp. NBC_01298]|uniref:hypothetical protein n=1 Tax=Streptomyces sp. NBC_01298 TaxID=2903817 RepID=UPI002E0D14AF|nr:hypothetical protein OG730_41855 [Streptomyces sp. NBC_01298]